MRRLMAPFERLLPKRSKRRPAKVKTRRRVAPRWLRPTLRYGGAVLALVLIAGTGNWLWTSGRVATALARTHAVLIEASVAGGLIVGEVYVSGRHWTPRDEVLDALAVERGTPLLNFDPEAARQRIEAIGWIRAATVERHLPDTVFVRLDERTPLALWQRDGRLVVVDRDGVVIDGAEAERFAKLLVIVGEDAPVNVVSLIGIMSSEPTLVKRVEAAVRVGGRRWNLHLDNGIDVQLPEEGIANAWRRLADYERQHRLLARDIAGVDLRLPDRLVVRRPPAPTRQDATGKST